MADARARLARVDAVAVATAEAGLLVRDDEILDRLRAGASVTRVANDLIEPRQRVLALARRLRAERLATVGSAVGSAPATVEVDTLAVLLERAAGAASRSTRATGRRARQVVEELRAKLSTEAAGR